jgi:hypothetical protein
MTNNLTNATAKNTEAHKSSSRGMVYLLIGIFAGFAFLLGLYISFHR